MNQNGEKEKWWAHLSYRVARGVAVVVFSFSLIVCILLIANYLQLKAVDPLNNPALTSLLEKLEMNPNDEELRDEIRAIDLLARKAYFTSQWQIRAGGFMLLGGVVLFIVCLKIMKELRPRIPQPGKPRSEDSIFRSKSLARRLIAGGGTILLGVSLLFALLSYDELTGRGVLKLSRIMKMGEDQEVDVAGRSPNEKPEPRFRQIREGVIDYPSPENQLDNWPSFRGPGGLGRAGSHNAPTFWDGTSGEGILWKAALPKPGLNSPILWQDLLFLSGADEDGQEVYCFNRHTGDLLWSRQINDIPGSPAVLPEVSPDTGYAAPTMTTDGQRVYAIFSTGDIVCFDFEGNRVWVKNLGMPENHYGHASSLIMYRSRLLVQYDDAAEPRLIALDAATGELQGEILREVMASWASPILVNTGSRHELILSATPYLTSYNPETGEELWRVECLMGEVGPSPSYAAGRVFAVNQNAILAAIDIETREMLWEAYDDLPDASSPLATDRYLIVPTSYGVVTSFNAGTGEVLWTHEFDKGFYSSPILVGDKVYLMDRSGVMHIFMAAEEFQLVAEAELGERSDSTPAFMEDRIYIRGIENLYCIGNADE
jgi:outer membrane protein assembly factor BamB